MRRSFLRAFTLPATLALTALRLVSDGGGWNQFRGPNGSGVVPDCHPPVLLNAATVTWNVPVPPGLSSPVIQRGRLFLTAVENERLLVLALDTRSGRELWRREAPRVPLEKVHRSNSLAVSTPLVIDDRVHVYFGSFGLLCYDLDGTPQWNRPIPTPKNTYGMATSPIAFEENLILVLDSDADLPDSRLSQSRMIAVRRSDGETVWETARPLQRSGWSTPMIWNHEGGPELVILGSGRLASYNPHTGAENWFTTGFSRETVAVPVAGNGLLFALASMLGGGPDEKLDPEPFWQAVMHFDANGDGKLERAEMTGPFTFPLRPELPVDHVGFGIPLPDDPARRQERLQGIFGWVDKDQDGFWTREEFAAHLSFRDGKPILMAVRPGGTGDVTGTHVVWELNRSIPEIPSPLFYEDRLYLVRNGGILTAVNAVNGEILYRERLGGSGQYSASPVLANDHLYLLSNRGHLSVVKAGDTFEPVGSYDLEEPASVTPAIDTDTLYVRTESRLLAFRRSASEQGRPPR
ncbi:MAG: PQQ-binding-like beta-propeller repeat protein [Verrucomicrobiales bacterium]|nr:PQQ-binding-like beta-propeller repeat protein [Verrucomicrobiales bacterium]MCP5527925.1 PQQ-binding-like beta-propeller repeat protein [Verrucomicrobiales bacterium]